MKPFNKIISLLLILCQVVSSCAASAEVRLFWNNGDHECKSLTLKYEDERVQNIDVGPSDSLKVLSFSEAEEVSKLKAIFITWENETIEFPITGESFIQGSASGNLKQMNVFLY
jgi:hypothetical protein